MTAILFNIQRFSLHDGPGIRTTFFFKGCNLACAWCANPESHSPCIETAGDSVYGKEYSVDQLIDEALKDRAFYDKSGGGVTLSGGEPLLWPEFVSEFTSALKALGIDVGIETAAHIGEGVFTRVLALMNFAYIDLKHYDGGAHKKGTGVNNALILRNIGNAVESGVPTTLRIPVIPGFNSSPDDARGFGELIATTGVKHVHILPFHNLGEGKYDKLGRAYAYANMKQTPNAELEPYAELLRSHGLEVQVGG